MTPEFRTVRTNGINLRCAVAGKGPLVLFVHGFPESWFSWRHQLQPVADAGFTACAIDVRGYGGSDKPHPVSAYAMETMVADIAGLVEALSPHEKAILVGHDWGAPMVWHTALARPDRVRAVGGLSVPWMGLPAMPFIDLIHEVWTRRGLFFYQEWFQAEGPPEAELEGDVRGGLRRFYYAISGEAPDGTWPLDKKHGDSLLHRLPDPQPFPAWLSRADEDYYVQEFTGSGFRGPINRYRNHRADFDWVQQFKDRRIEQPALFIGGERDLVLKMAPGVDMVALMRAQLPNLQVCEVLKGCGHWTQQERPEEVTALLVPWLKSLG